MTMKNRILVVDDSNDNLYMMETLLKGYGYDVTTAENGEQALEKARRDPPDLIVSDSLMPVMDGFNLCRAWKADDTLRHRPFVLYTATDTDSRDEKFALDLGADRFIIKPQEPDVLIGIIRELLEDGYRARQVETKPLEEEMQFFRQYNEILFKKLEQKMQDLEAANLHLRLSEESYRRTFLNASDVIYTVDSDFILRSISPSVERNLGYKPQDFVDRPITEFGRLALTPESFERAIADAAVVLGGQRIASTTYEFIAKDGTIRYGEVSGSPLQQDGKITGFVSVARDVTDRVLTERALRENEEKYRSLFDHCPDAFYALDVEGGFLSVNDSTCRISGYSREEFMRMKFDRLLVPEEKQRVRSHFQKALHGEPQNFKTTILRKDGVQVILQVTKTPVTVEGKIVGVYAIAEDITERERAEEALKDRDARYKKLFSEVPGMIYQFMRRPNGTYCVPYTTEFIKKIFGCLPQDVVEDSAPMAKVILPDDLKEVVRSIESSSEQMTIWRCQFRVRIPGQPIRGILGHSTPERLADGSTLWHGFVTDITDRVRAEKTMRALSSRQEAILAAVPEIIMEVDNNKVYTWVNSRGIEFFGEDVIGKEAAFYFEGEQKTYDMVSPLFTGADDFIYLESWQRRKDGEKRLLAW